MIRSVNILVMDGIAAIHAIRRLPVHRTPPILLLTTEAEDRTTDAARAAGATGWLGKPFNPDSLLTVIS